MTSEGFAFNAWYITTFGPHAANCFNGEVVRFTPVSALIAWSEGRR